MTKDSSCFLRRYLLSLDLWGIVNGQIEESRRIGYPVRYWWLTQAIDITNCPDRLIVCVHHPANDENAGMYLYDTLKARQVSYNELEAAVMEEYLFLGQRIIHMEDIDLAGWSADVPAPTSLTVLPYSIGRLLLIDNPA